MLFIKSLIALVLMPGTVAFVLPVLYGWLTGGSGKYAVAGIILVTAGTLILLWCVREFYTEGKGTLSPWVPPRHLVISGPYQWVRNPMYIGVLLILAGWTVYFISLFLLAYMLAVGAAFHGRVKQFEEPWLKEQFGNDWVSYAGNTPPWLPQINLKLLR